MAPPQQGGGGAVLTETVETASIVYELSRLLDEASGEAPGFPVAVATNVLVRDGVAVLLLSCEDATVEGTVELLARRGDRLVRAGRGRSSPAGRRRRWSRSS